MLAVVTVMMRDKKMLRFWNTYSKISDRALALSFFNLPFQFYLNNVTTLRQLTRKVRHTLQHGDSIVTIDYCDVTSPYL